MKNFYRITFVILLIFASAIPASALTAGFTADVTAGCAPLVVHFTNTSTGATSYFWDFGTGTTSTLTDPSTSFTTPGTYTVTLKSTSGGTTITTTMTITVYPPPTVSFSISDTSVCPGVAVSYMSTTLSGVPGAVSYVWGFGDGGVSTLAGPTHAYTTPGYYNVTLTATNSKGCVASLTIPTYMHIFTPPSPSFTASPTSACKAPVVVTFSNSTSGTFPMSYRWDLGDGGSSTLSGPVHTYSASGSYDVRLVAIDANGCQDSIYLPGYINVGTIKAAFTFPSPVCAGSPAIFSNTSTSHVSAAWSYGDGGTDVTDNGSHAYSSPGTYLVRLIIDDGGGCKDTVKQTIKVLAGPVISFTITPTNPCPPPIAISFSGTAPGGSLITWDYGDGTLGAGPTTSHTYLTDNFFVITMSATDPTTGCTSSMAQVEKIYNHYGGIGFKPLNEGCAPLTVTMNEASLSNTPMTIPYPYPYPIVSYSWWFADGSPVVTTPTVTHTYTAEGVYHVACTYTTSNGCTFIDSGVIQVGTPPITTISEDKPEICYRDVANFKSHVIKGPVTEQIWMPIGWDGRTDNIGGDDTVSAKYTDVGKFLVVMIPYDKGCPGKPDSMYITIDSPKSGPVAVIPCSPRQKVSLYDSSLGDDSHLWILSDGTTYTSDSVIHNFPLAQVYSVTLTTFNTRSGCRDTSTMTVDLRYPHLDFVTSRARMCRGDVDTLTAIITGDVVHYYEWVGGRFPDPWPTYPPPYVGRGIDTAYTNVVSIPDTFYNAGQFDVTLITRDHNGCFDTLTKPKFITIGDPKVNFTATPAAGCLPFAATIKDISTDVPTVTTKKYTWLFGDGGTATTLSSTISHTFLTSGTFTTKEYVVDDIGCVDSGTIALITVWKPKADFSAYQYPCLGASTTFTNTSVDMATCVWTFGDGATSTLAAPTHTYTATGSYSVNLTVTDAHGCTDTRTLFSYIQVTDVHADFTMSDSLVICPPKLVNFTDKSTGATSYSWDMGDGTTSLTANPSDLYITTGLYVITLTATNAHGCSSIHTATLNLFGFAGAFKYAPITGCAPLKVHFKGSLSNVPSIIWDFSDGSTSPSTTIDSTDHIYTMAGAYLPKLILGDGSGCQNSSLGIDTIKVDIVTPDFSHAPDNVCINTPMVFTDKSKSYFSSITGWNWTMSDGATDMTSAPSFTYSASGTYSVTLRATDGWGCPDSVTKTINVLPLPDIKAYPDTLICLYDTATLSATGGVSYTWTPTATLSGASGGMVKAGPDVKTTYTVTGTDEHGCASTDTVTVSLRTKAKGYVSGGGEVCRGVPVPLYDSGGTSYRWLPEASLDNALSQSPFATPENTQRYIAITYLGRCTPDTGFVWVAVHQLPTVDAGPNQRILEGFTAQLQATGTNVEKYAWDADPTLSCDTCTDPIASMMETTRYAIHVTSDFGCKASDTVTIQVYCDKSQIFIPNTFTPNGDGENDIFYPRGVGMKAVSSFRIYNRWGQLLFQKTDIQLNDAANAWDGSYLGNAPKPDVYVYVIEAQCRTGEPVSIKGDITILR